MIETNPRGTICLSMDSRQESEDNFIDYLKSNKENWGMHLTQVVPYVGCVT